MTPTTWLALAGAGLVGFLAGCILVLWWLSGALSGLLKVLWR